MNRFRFLLSLLWKIPVCGAVMALGVMLGGGLATALGLEMPTVPWEVDEAGQLRLLLLGGMALAAGLVAINAGLPGRRRERWLVLATFAFVVNGIGNLLEGSIFSTIGGELAILAIRLPSALLCALAVVLLFNGSGDREERLWQTVSTWLSRWSPATLTTRLGMAFVAFPLIYFFFGAMIAPVVSPYYEALEFLVIPPLPTLVMVLFIRSLLLLLASLPVIASWSRSRVQLVFALGLGHFVAVGLSDLIQAPFMPAVLQWIHGAEILVDSIVYASVLAWLLLPRRAPGDEMTPALRDQPA